MKNLLNQIAHFYGIPPEYELGRSGGETRIAISAALIFPEVRLSLIELVDQNKIKPRMCDHAVIISQDILGGIIMERPLLGKSGGKGGWEILKQSGLQMGSKRH